MDGNNDADTWRASTRQTKPFLSLPPPLSIHPHPSLELCVFSFDQSPHVGAN